MNFTTKFFKKLIYHESNCWIKTVVYLLDYKRCQKQYIEMSEWQFYFRQDNQRHIITSADYNT